MPRRRRSSPGDGSSALNRPVRVAHVIVSLGVGGAETMLTGIVSELDRSQFDPVVVTLRGPGPLASTLRARGVPVHALGSRGALGGLLLPLRLASLFRRERIDLAQTWLYHADLIGGLAGRLARIPVVWGVQSGRSTGSTRTTRWIRMLCGRLSRHLPAGIVCCAESSRQVHLQLGYANIMTVVPNACDVDRFHPDEASRASMRAELGIGPDASIVGMIARVDALKDHETLVRAIGLLDDERVDLVLVGTGVDEQNETLVAAAADAGLEARCHLLGPRSDVPRLLTALDVFVLSSRSEGLPLVLPEALASGVPCVATDVGDCAEVIGDAGRIVPVGDARSLAEAIRDLVDLAPEGRAALRAVARRRAEEGYSLEVAARSYSAVWRAALDPERDSLETRPS